MKRVISFVLWVIAAFLVIMALPFLPSVGSILLLLAAVLVAPVHKFQELLSRVFYKKFKRPALSKGLLIAFISFIGICAAGSSAEPADTLEVPSSIIEEIIDEDETEDSLEYITEPSPIPTPAVSEEINSNSSPETTPNPSMEPVSEETPEPTPEPTLKPTPEATPEIPSEPLNSTFSIHFIDVGQADAALVECDGHYMFIDGGNKADSNVIYSVLKAAKVTKLDILVGTHAHENHIGGLPGAFNYTTADITLYPVKSYDSNAFEDFVKYAEQKGGCITVPRVGDTYLLGSALITILGVNGGSDTNDTSIVLRIDYGETSFLFTGDAEREAEQAILNSGMDLSATVLKVGHHGSDTSTTYPFLREIMPQYAVISVGKGNSYGHPTDDTLSRLRDADVTVYRTDLQGDIYCSSDGKTVSFTVERNANADTLAALTSTPVSTPTPTPSPSPQPSEEEEGRLYIVNTNTGKFHYPSCSSADDIKESNR